MANSIKEKLSKIFDNRSSWMAAHFWWPLSPYLLVTFIRFASTESLPEFFSCSSFNSAQLALSLGFIAEYAQKSVLNAQITLADDEEKEKQRSAAASLRTKSYLLFLLFITVEVVLITLDKGNTDLLLLWKILRISIFFGSIFLLLELVAIKDSFKLTADI